MPDLRIFAAAISAAILLGGCTDGGDASGATPAASGATPAASGATPAASGATPAASGASGAAHEAPAAASPEAPAAETPAAPPHQAPAPTVAPEAAATESPATPPESVAKAPAYEVSCPDGATQAEKCQVGKTTYIGWRSFHTHCFQCHGGSAMGSTFAPNLMDRLNTRVDYTRFQYVLQHGYTGKVGAMPSFAKNTAVLKDTDALYSYLRARADGALPAGRPVRKP